MRFLADENCPRAAVAALEVAGHDVAWVRLAAPGADADVLAAAARKGRVLLTFDKDFGELAARSALPPGCRLRGRALSFPGTRLRCGGPAPC